MRLPVRLAATVLPLLLACQGDRGVTGPDDARVRTAQEPSMVLAVSLTCGASVVTSIKLGADMSCPGDAISVDADGIDLDLNGHAITGAGTGNGISVRGRHHVTIHGGTVAGFTTGILVGNSHHVVIKDNRLTQNREAIFLNGSSDNVVKENEAWQNAMRGIMLRPSMSGAVATRNLVVENVLGENPVGILLFGQPGNTVEENWITASHVAAIDLTGGGASGNLIRENWLQASAVGVRFGSGWTGNFLIENRLAGNQCAVQGSTAGNTLQENLLVGNGVDAC